MIECQWIRARVKATTTGMGMGMGMGITPIVYGVIQQRLNLAKSELSPDKALSQLSPIQRHKVRINNAQPIYGISSINDLQAQVLESLKINKST
jgi:hypothetical protein